MSLVHLNGIAKSFKGKPALKPLSLQVEKGEIFGLLGHNGAGKSTTFGIILGHVRADQGTVTIGGYDTSTQRRQALLRTGAIFETPCFYDYLSASSNLDYFTSLAGHVPPSRREEIVEFVGLKGRMNDRVGTFSHGMRQRLALAQALLPDPDFILLDEPNDGLDPQGIIETRELILRLQKDHGKTVMFSSHILAEVEQLCTRVAILHQGKLIFCGNWQETSAGSIRLRIALRNPARGQPVFERAGLMAEEADNIFIFPPGTDVPELNAALVANGAEVECISPVRMSLEDFYLNAVGQPIP
jgi:ABC-2 type transport system ATP-binding protein